MPNFAGSDDYCVKLTLDLKVIHPKMLALMQQISEEKLDVMSTEDYLILGAIYRGEDVHGIAPKHFEHLVELGIVKLSEHGVEPANGGAILAIGNQSETISDRFPIEISDREQLVLDYIASHSSVTTAELAKLIEMSQRSALSIVQKLITDGLVEKDGNNRHSTYSLKK